VHEPKPPPRGLHRDWRTWVGVGILLLAAAAYVLNLDRVIVPVAAPAAQSPGSTPAATPAPSARP
jgi:hypothetical protein